MDHKKQIEENGYFVFDITKNNDTDAITPIDINYHVIVLCYAGEATFETNMQPYVIHQGDSFCVSNVLYKKTVSMSDDFRASVIVSERTYSLNSIVGIPAGYLESLYTKPVAKIDDDNVWKLICSYFDHLLMYQTMQNLPQELSLLAFRSVVLLLTSVRIGDNYRSAVYSHSEVYFRQFIELIDEHIKREHEVSFYAEQLHITAKYLSEVCKAKSGYKAKEIISSFLISKIKQEMIMSGKSIKTIAYEYGFADQSSLGKFFSKMTGMSPSEFKKSKAISL